MAVSNFKQERDAEIFKHVDQLIQHVSQLQPHEPNYRIAEEFIMQNFNSHTFTDTNENEVSRNFKRIQHKFDIHNQSKKGERLEYLKKEFFKRPLKNIGISESHHSAIHLLLLLSQNPTSIEELQLQNHQYLDKGEKQRLRDQQMEEELKQIEEEDHQIQALRNEWERDMDEYSDFEADQHDGLELDEDLHDVEMEDVGEKEEDRRRHDERKMKIKKQQIRDNQVYFGGMPFGSIKAPKVKIKDMKQTKNRIKQFDINAFLEKYLNEMKVPKTSYEEYLEQKRKDDLEKETQKQQKLKEVLNIRTFDEIQKSLCLRTSNNQLEEGALENESKLNGYKKSYDEPLNLVRDYSEEQKQDMGFWSFKTVTERQILMDTILMLQGYHNQTYSQEPDQRNLNKFQLAHYIQVTHLSPKSLDNMIQVFLEMGVTFQKTIIYLESLKINLHTIGLVIESFCYQIDLIIRRYLMELQDLQQIALLQAGQISKSQLKLNNLEESQIQYLIQIDQPLTLMRLQLIMEQYVFKKIRTIHDLIQNGIMDFLIFERDQHIQYKTLSILEHSRDQDEVNQSKSHIKVQYIDLELEKIKPADRVTFLINYLYLITKNNQLLNLEIEVNLIKDLQVACIEPYVFLLSNWVTKGELKDPKQEFFIKANPKVFNEEQEVKLSSQVQWKESYVVRTINIKDLQGQNYFENEQKIEISAPLFLRPIMKEILSIGKSIKIIRFLEQINQDKSAKVIDFENFYDQYRKLKDQVYEVVKPENKENKQIKYFDEKKAEPTRQIIRCYRELKEQANYEFEIQNGMNQNQVVVDYRELLDIAPFNWTALDDNNQARNIFVRGAFEMPQVIKQVDTSQISTDLSNYGTPEKDFPRVDSPQSDVDMSEISGEKEERSRIRDDPHLEKGTLEQLSKIYNYSKQQMATYEGSMSYFQSYLAFDYLMNMNQNRVEVKEKQINFKGFTIENYIKETLINPIKNIYIDTCLKFAKKLKNQCQIQDNLSMLRKIYFMEDGYQMHTFCTFLFKQLDKGIRVDNLYMINGHFQESMSSSIYSQKFKEKVRLIFQDQQDIIKLMSINALDFIQIQFQSDWPLEIIIDQESIKHYNTIMNFLMKIKRVNYVLQLKDFWLKNKPETKKYNQMNVKEQILFQNKKLLLQLQHQMQLFQRELLHFSNNLEYYIKTRSIKQCCRKFDEQLQGIEELIDQNNFEGNNLIDMDSLVEIHEEFLNKVLNLCMLDSRSQYLNFQIMNVLQISLDFRDIVNNYFFDRESSNKDSDDSSDFDLDFDINDTPIKNSDEEKVFGMGKLKINNPYFMDKIEECQSKFNSVKDKFKSCMNDIMQNLQKFSKKGVFSNLDEAFARLNFNNYYIDREKEGLQD